MFKCFCRIVSGAFFVIFGFASRWFELNVLSDKVLSCIVRHDERVHERSNLFYLQVITKILLTFHKSSFLPISHYLNNRLIHEIMIMLYWLGYHGFVVINDGVALHFSQNSMERVTLHASDNQLVSSRY